MNFSRISSRSLILNSLANASRVIWTLEQIRKHQQYSLTFTCKASRNKLYLGAFKPIICFAFGWDGQYDLPTWPAQWWQFGPEENFLWHKFLHKIVAPKWAVCCYDPPRQVQLLHPHGGPDDRRRLLWQLSWIVPAKICVNTHKNLGYFLLHY